VQDRPAFNGEEEVPSQWWRPAGVENYGRLFQDIKPEFLELQSALTEARKFYLQ
jgi:hypothetical protein